jgi:septum formation protein
MGPARSGRLILASASPRRRGLLDALGIAYEAVVPEAEELSEGMEPDALVVENARRKAAAGARVAGARPDDVVIGVDTEVVLDGRVLGKAAAAAEARTRLEALAGRTHDVLSGVAVLGAGEARTGVARSRVTFAALEPATIDLYLASGEWRDRAGAYAIQGLGALLVERVEGDFSNVVGLPLRLLFSLLPALLENPRAKP